MKVPQNSPLLIFQPALHWASGILLLLGILISGCKKDEIEINPVPFLRIAAISPTTVTQFADSILVILEYDDGDGDLGFPDPDSMSIAVTDSRFDAPDWYFLQPLAPLGQSLHIRGSIRLVLSPPFLLGNGTPETVTFQIRLKDRAGNWSNEVESTAVTINP